MNLTLVEFIFIFTSCIEDCLVMGWCSFDDGQLLKNLRGKIEKGYHRKKFQIQGKEKSILLTPTPSLVPS